MASNSYMKIAVMLTAIDQMSNVVDKAVNKSVRSLDRMAAASKMSLGGYGMLEAGKGVANAMQKPLDTFKQYELEAAKLQSGMMNNKGVLDQAQWKRVDELANQLGNKLPGTTADMYQMFNTLKSLGIGVESIVNGTGAATANLAYVIGESYNTTADAVGRMKNATGVADKDMMRFLDNISKAKNAGVDLHEMQTAFSNSGSQLRTLGLQGIDATEKMTRFYAMFIRTGVRGEKIGTNFTRVLNEMLNPEKYKKMQDAAMSYGVTLDLLDAKGNFVGVDNMVEQFAKLNGLSVGKISNIFKPLTGSEGFDDQIAKALSTGGMAQWNEINDIFNRQASLVDKQNKLLGTLAAKTEAATGTWDNFMAAIGEKWAPTAKKFLDWWNGLLDKVIKFTDAHPGLTKMIGVIGLILAALLTLGGGILIVSGLTAAFAALDLAILANPITWVVGAFIAGITLIYAYWDDLPEWFHNLWQTTKNVFSMWYTWYENSFFKPLVTTLGILWDYFSPLLELLNHILNFITKFTADSTAWLDTKSTDYFNSGKNLGTSFNNGFNKSLSFEDRLSKIQAKVSTALGINGTTTTVAAAQQAMYMNPNNAQPIKIMYNPTITVNGGATEAQGQMVAEANKKHFDAMMRDYEHRQRRVRF